MIKLTNTAISKVSSMLNDSEDGKVLRVFIEPGGCSGFEYGMSVDFPKKTDKVGSCDGVSFAVDADSLEYLDGSEVHFDDGLTGKGFEIRNPNAQSTCGCGKSFH